MATFKLVKDTVNGGTYLERVREENSLTNAAPDLLAACEAVLKLIDRPRNSYDEEVLCDMVRAAVSKARGGVR